VCLEKLYKRYKSLGFVVVGISNIAIEDNMSSIRLGYKGGSDYGVLQSTQLLGSRSGRFYCISATWNDRNEPLERGALSEIVERIARLLRV